MNIIPHAVGISNLTLSHNFSSASTEGNIQLANLMNDEGCIMRWTPLVKLATGTEIVKFDPIEEKIIRNDKGYAIKADWDEPGRIEYKNVDFACQLYQPDVNPVCFYTSVVNRVKL